MNIIVVGATGRTGRRIIEEALSRGHEVTAFSRSAENLRQSYPKISTLNGDVLDGLAVERAIRASNGHSDYASNVAVISVLGADDFKNPGNTLSSGMNNIIRAARKLGVRRVVAVAGAGVLQQTETQLRRERTGYPAVFQPISEEHVRVFEALSQSELDWTLVCTPELPDGKATENYRALKDYLPEDGHFISTGDVASFILDELVHRHYLKTRVGLAT